MEISSATLNALRTNYRGDFNFGLSTLAKPKYTSVATYISSSALSNTYGFIRDWPMMREWIGDRQVKSIAEGAYSIVNDEFEATVAVKRKNIETDTLGVYKPMMQSLGQAAGEHPDRLVFQLMAAGDSTLCWDGQNYFDTDHPVGDDGDVYSNLQAGEAEPWVLMCTTKPLKPLIYQERIKPRFVAMTDPNDETVFSRAEYRYGVDMSCAGGFAFPQLAFMSRAALTAENYDAARTAMGKLVSDEGHKLEIVPDLLAHGPSNRSAAKQLFGASIIPGGGTNIFYEDINLLQSAWLAE